MQTDLIAVPPTAPALPWMIETCGRKAVREPAEPAAPAVEVPLHRAISRSIEYLRDAPLAIEGQGGDQTTFVVAAQVKDLGVTAEAALDLLAEHWNPRNSPPWTHDDLATKVRNAYAYGENAQGSKAPEALFSKVDPETIANLGTQPPAPPRSTLPFVMLADVKPDLKKQGLVHGLLDTSAMSVVYGESGSGKTFAVLSIAYAIAAGVPWMGRKVQQGAVVYIAAEGGDAIQKRGMALRIDHGIGQRAVPLAIVPAPVDLSGAGADVASIVELIAEVEAATGQRVTLIVVDTLARAIGGDNENSPEGMGAFVRNVDKIRDATRAHLLIVHHSGKDKLKGARGHSSLRAATDTELEVGTTGERTTGDRVIAVTKQRDMEQGPPIGFDLKAVQIGHDAEGNPVTSCVVVPRQVEAPNPFAPKFVAPGSKAGQALAVLLAMTTARPNAPDAVSVRAWREEFISRYHPGDARVGATAFRRAEQKLRESNRLFVDGDNIRAISPETSSIKRAS